MSSIQDITAAIENGKLKIIEELVSGALESGEDPNNILENGMVSAMTVIGEKFQANEIFVPEMLISAKTMKKGIEILRPHLTGGSLGKMGKFIIGTVEGDMHDIGKNLVALMIESAGFEVIDLGVDVPADNFVTALQDHPDCKLVGLSSLLTTTMSSIKKTIGAINEAGYKGKVKIMVGGAPVTQEYADEIGADAYAPDAGSAAALAKKLAQ